MVKYNSFSPFQLTIAKHCGIGGEYIKRNHTYSALSRCNGMGSFKMTIAGAHNQRMSPYGNEMRRLSMSNSRNGNDGANNAARTPTHGGRNDINNSLGGKDDDRYRQRFVSVSSQSTLLTTISKSDGNGVITMKSGDCGINNNIDTVAEKLNKTASNLDDKLTDGGSANKHPQLGRSGKQATQAGPSTLGTIAEKLKRRVMLFKTTSSSTPGAASSTNANNGITTNTASSRHRDGRKLEKGNSVDSANTNTISNSSLQEMDDDEFDSTELAKYMGQINNEIR